jgi:hypothetical protein
MANSGRPNLRLVRFALDNFWTIDRMERYIENYQPGGVPIHIVRHILGHNRVNLADYAHSLVKFVTILVALGHAKPPALILLDLLITHTLRPLTNAEVGLARYFIPVDIAMAWLSFMTGFSWTS